MDERFIILSELINKDLQLEDEDSIVGGEEKPDLNFFHMRLTQLIRYLFDHDMHRLLHVMYRLDVSEQKFHHAMQSLDKDEAASKVADLVLEREMQKVQTRLHYKKHGKF